MEGSTLGSMQQWRPTNLVIDATISPKVIGTVDPGLITGRGTIKDHMTKKSVAIL